MACRDLLCRLEARGLISLPARLSGVRKAGYRHHTRAPELLNCAPLHSTLGEIRDELSLQLVRDSQQKALYKGLVGTYHYLSYQQATGAQLKYIAALRDRPVACLSFGPAAWKIGPRDQFIGWSVQARGQHLPSVANNDRFVILPWVQINGLASLLLAKAAQRLRWDWPSTYGQDLVLIESFVEQERFAGAAYAAAHWICVGPTVGRGRHDRTHAEGAPFKNIWLYPLRCDFRVVLGQGE